MTFDDANDYAEKNNFEIVSANFCDSTRFQALIVVFKKPIVIDCVGAPLDASDIVSTFDNKVLSDFMKGADK
jgi:hypothetical protein